MRQEVLKDLRQRGFNMLIIMEENATYENIEQIKKYLIEKNFDFHQSTGLKHVIIGVIGEVLELSTEEIEKMPGVQQVVRITGYKKRG